MSQVSLSPSRPRGAVRSPTRLGRHHFAHLRAVAEGIELQASALLYLGLEHGAQSAGAHHLVVHQVRGLAKRAGERDWRLVGITIRVHGQQQRPTLDEFMAERDLDGWTEREQLDFYAEAYPLHPKALRRERLRQRQLMLLRRLEEAGAVDPLPSDRIDTWFAPSVAQRLQPCGVLLLQDLQARISVGGRWWCGISAIGPVKAQRLASFLEVLLPAAKPLARPNFMPTPTTETLPSSGRSDAKVVQDWIEARAGSAATAKSYQREARRLVIWLQRERGKGLAAMTVDDCRTYMVFMERVPPGWISRDHAAVLTPGWAPFKGPLSVASRRQAVTVLSSMFDWLVSVDALPRNPWLLMNRKIGDDRSHDELDSRAFTPEAWAEILRVLALQAPSPALHRVQFLLPFLESTGLRSAELLDARCGHLRRHKGHWALQVQGKGSRNRIVALPGQARQALERYLQVRGLPRLEHVAPELPLLASANNPSLPISYQALYRTLKLWLAKAVRESNLQGQDRANALRASPHWLRHTFGTRALERETPLEVVQGQLGHADPRTTMGYAKAQLTRRLENLDRAFAAS